MATLGFAQTDCLSFDGIDDYVVSGLGDILDVGTSDWSYQIWFKTTDTTGGLMGKSLSGNQNGRWSIHFVAGTLRVIVQNGTIVNLLDANGTWNDGAWHNATVTYDRDDKISLYVNGGFNKSIDVSAQGSSDMNSPGYFFLGTYGNANGTAPLTGYYLNGSLDEARVWNKCLTQAEVEANWDKQVSYPQANLVGYWRMNEGSGSILYDLSGNNHHCALLPALPVGSGPTWVTGGGPETLPVELSSFTASFSVTNYVTLHWITQSETNLFGYHIFRNTEDDLASAELVSPLIMATNAPSQQVYSFQDNQIYESGTYYYWLQSIDYDSSFDFHGPISVVVNFTPGSEIPAVPQLTGLKRVYPNPFSSSAAIVYGVEKTANVGIQIFNSKGQLVRTYSEGSKSPKSYTIHWDAKDDDGNECSSGVYLVRMKAGDEQSSLRVLLKK